jgi:ABC-type bacteriocin/lantibiotic exporter with double-glycine peptidase domain
MKIERSSAVLNLVAGKDVLFGVLGKSKRQAASLVLIILFSAVLETLSVASVLPILSGLLDDNGSLRGFFGSPKLVDGRTGNPVIVISVGFILFFLFRAFFTLFKENYAARFVNDLRHRWSINAYHSFLMSDYLALRGEKQGNIINSVTNEPMYAAKAIMALIDILSSIVLAVFFVGLLVFIDWKGALSTLILLVMVVSSVWRISNKFSSNVGKERIRRSQHISHLVAESISGVRQLKNYSLESRAVSYLDSTFADLMRMMTRFTTANAAPRALAEFFVVLVIVFAFLVVTYTSPNDVTSTLPTMAVFAIALIKLFSVSSLLLAKRMELSTYWPSVRLVKQRAVSNPVSCLPGAIGAYRSVKEIEFRKVCFSYVPEQPVLSEVSVNLYAGQIIGVVGKSGSGKSSFCDLVMGLVHPTSGGIYVNGSLRGADEAKVRAEFGYVSQESFMFNLSVKENIRLGNPEASDRDIHEAAVAACAHEFVAQLPEGYDTIIGIGGVGLSGGQKQRIALAQALVRKPSVLILDEATSGLDEESETAVFHSIRSLYRESIVLVVSHRSETLQRVDRVMRISGQKVALADRYEQFLDNRSF